MKRWFGLVLFLSLMVTVVRAQQIESDTAESNLVIIDKADRIRRLLTQENTEVLILTGDVLMHQDSLFMSCDSARKEGNNLLAVGNVILQQWDSLNVFSHRLAYNGNSKDAYLRDSVVLQSKDQKLFTDSLAYNTETKIAIYNQGAILTNDTTTLYSRRGIYYVARDEIYFKDSIEIQSEDFELFADTLKFNTEQQIAYFLGPTRIDLRDSGQVYCEGGYFDMPNRQALFTDQAQYVEGDRIAEGDSIFYDGALDQVILKGNAVLLEPGKRATADQIIYSQAEDVLTLIGNAHFKDSTRSIVSEELIYNVAEDRLTSNTRSTLDNAPQFLEADTISFDNESGLGAATGHVIWRDTASNYTILCQKAYYYDSSSYLKAYGGRPLLISEMEEDSFFLSADTMIFFEAQTPQDTAQLFRAFYNVMIYKNDLQALCDSLTYSSADSIFRLYEDPIIWSDTSQFVADTVSILLADNEIDKILLKKNAFILNSADQVLFNQMKGKDITAYFSGGELDEMLIKGNATSIYYVLDDGKAYIGANEMICSSILIRFGDNQVQETLFYDNAKATFHPIQDANPNELKLEGFDWRINERPHSVSEITTFTP